MAAEQPEYTVEKEDGPLQVRSYPALIVAEVTVGGDRDSAANESFRLLAGYIFGGNARRQKIAMTAPVLQAPVAGAWQVRFVMPKAYPLDALPPPADPRVRLLRLEASRWAAMRFSGWAEPAEVERWTQALDARIAALGLRARGPVTLARYDPPQTPAARRRNEVMRSLDTGLAN